MKQQFAAKHPWTILAAGAAIQVLTGLPAAWGVFQQPVMEEYGLSEQGRVTPLPCLLPPLGWGVCWAVFYRIKGPALRSIVGHSPALRRFFAAAFLPGWAGWGFFLAFSIPAGLGTAFLYPSIQSCAQKWYAGRKGLATGVIGGAVGLSGAFLTLFVRAALRGFGPVQGIRGAFLGHWVRLLCRCALRAARCSATRRRKNSSQAAKTPSTFLRGRCCAQSSTGCVRARYAFPLRRCCCSVPSS